MADPRPPASTVTPQQRNVIFGALMLVLLLASLDQTIVSTASTPIYGKLGDLFGRKRVLQGAVAIFLIASVLCGLAQDMTQPILFRGLQGLGAGGLMVLTIASVGDL